MWVLIDVVFIDGGEICFIDWMVGGVILKMFVVVVEKGVCVVFEEGLCGYLVVGFEVILIDG